MDEWVAHSMPDVSWEEHQKAIADEREACAKLVEDWPDHVGANTRPLAAAIRARQ